jgi:hypothetical protein
MNRQMERTLRLVDRRNCWAAALAALLMGVSAQIAGAQTPRTEYPASPSQTQNAPPTAVHGEPEKRNLWIDPPKEHRFWDKQNDWLFAAVGASRTFDYFSTLNLRRRGDQEILVTNDLVDDHAAFAVVEAAGTGVSIGASYLFHRYGHHKLERWTSIVHFGLTTGGAVRNYCLKTAHPK